MTNEENRILDNLYFISSFNELRESVPLEEDRIKSVLKNMIRKGWVAIYPDLSGEPLPGLADFENAYKNYFYLAMKKGMLAHYGII